MLNKHKRAWEGVYNSDWSPPLVDGHPRILLASHFYVCFCGVCQVSWRSNDWKEHVYSKKKSINLWTVSCYWSSNILIVNLKDSRRRQIKTKRFYFMSSELFVNRPDLFQLLNPVSFLLDDILNLHYCQN